MTTMTRNHDHLLDQCMEAARADVDEQRIAEAANRFRDTLPSARPAGRRLPMPRWAGVALVLVVAVAIGPLLAPGNGAAFAGVQQWFSSFASVRMVTEMRHDGEPLMEIRVWAQANGAARIETGPVTHIVDPEAATMTTLLPGDQAMRMAIPGGQGWDETLPADASGSGSLAWFAELRDFQGEATLLPETRTIAGLLCQGFRLVLDGTTVTLWADVGTDRPVRLDAVIDGRLTMETNFVFNEAFPTELFEVPVNVRLVVGEEG